MNVDTTVQWQKLSLELDLLNTEDPNTIIPIVVGLSNLLRPETDQERIHRTINFMTYELIARAEDFSEQDRLEILNGYFFEEKGFQLIPPSKENDNENNLLIEHCLQNKKGEALPLAILYQHFANHLDLPIYLVNMHSMLVLKWVRSGKSSFINLLHQGREMTADELSNQIQAEKQLHGIDSDSCVDILPSRKIFEAYTKRLLECFRLQGRSAELLALFDVMLKLNPHCLDSLANRGLLRQQLGHSKEALCDFKKYFSFVEPETAPLKIQTAFKQLKSIEALNKPPSNTDIIH